MRSLILFISIGIFHQSLLARTSSYFAITGDRAMINIQSGNSFSPQTDDDALQLYKIMRVAPQDSMMGKGKKIEIVNAMTLIVAERGRGQYDGTLMLQESPGVLLLPGQKKAEIRREGSEAAEIASQFYLNGSKLDYQTAEGNLHIHVSQELFFVSYQE